MDSSITSAPGPLRMLASFVAAQENACRYCFGAQRAALRLMGRTEQEIQKLEHHADDGSLGPRERAVMQFCAQLARSAPRPARAEYDALIAHGLTPGEIAELGFVIVDAAFHSRVATILSVPPDQKLEGLPGTVLGFFVKHLVRRVLQKMSAPEVGIELSGPFTQIVTALSPAPAAGILRRAIDRALASPLLGRRAKLLCFAVIARALNAPRCEAEALLLLEADGLPRTRATEIVSQLGGPELSPDEASAVKFARETVRYQVGKLQTQARALAAGFSPEKLVEFAAVCGLANGVCRLEMLLP